MSDTMTKLDQISLSKHTPHPKEQCPNEEDYNHPDFFWVKNKAYGFIHLV